MRAAGDAAADDDLPVLLDVPPSDHIDVFLDAMRMDHQVDFRDRLEINTYAIDPADLFLSKLQIVNLNEKDVHDVITLVKDVYVDFQPHPGVLDLHHVADICAADWGLYIDVMNNIDTVVEHVADYDLGPRDAARVRRTLELAQDMMTEQAKTLRWRLRARIGRRVRWYSEVEEQFGGRTEDVSLAVRTKEGRAAGWSAGATAAVRDAASAGGAGMSSQPTPSSSSRTAAQSPAEKWRSDSGSSSRSS